MRLVLPLALLAGAAACGGSAPAPTAASTCDLTTTTLAGKAFVELEVQGDKSSQPNPQARVKFRDEGGTLKAAYTMKNGLHVYDYTCADSARDNELRCVTDPDFRRACLSLEVNKEGSCTAEALAELKFEGKAEDITKAIEDARKLVAEARKSEQWKSFQLINNNVANPVQGLIFVKVDQKNCRINIDDMFVTVYNGKRTEDFNPVGSNPFVKTDGDYLFDDCAVEGLLVDLATADLPEKLEDIPRERNHDVGAEVHYHYLGDDRKAEEGCTYTADVYANWAPVAKGVEMQVADGVVNWHTTHSWKDEDRKFIGAVRGQAMRGGFLHLTRHKTCGGKADKLDTVCVATSVGN